MVTAALFLLLHVECVSIQIQANPIFTECFLYGRRIGASLRINVIETCQVCNFVPPERPVKRT